MGTQYNMQTIVHNTVGLLPLTKNAMHCIEYRWKNHFSEVKGDVGMSVHEKVGEQEDTYTETRIY